MNPILAIDQTGADLPDLRIHVLQNKTEELYQLFTDEKQENNEDEDQNMTDE
jgi:hypothetical protein